uniref:Uncharacterized protein n=1 Tax=Malurus cyaneus samueli TaxID=2593467 RepID=A0A8C5UB10_9PASS
ISASETPKSKLETSSFPPVSTPAPAPKPLSNRSCCHFSGSCFGPPAPRPPRTGPPRRPAPAAPAAPAAPRWLRFSLMMSSRDMSILSAMMAAPLRSALRPRCARAGSGRGGAEARGAVWSASGGAGTGRCGCACGAGTESPPGSGCQRRQLRHLPDGLQRLLSRL